MCKTNSYIESLLYSAKRNRLLNQLNQIEIGRKKLELRGHKSFQLDLAQVNNNNANCDNDNNDAINNDHDSDVVVVAVDNKSSNDSSSKTLIEHEVKSIDEICVDPIQPEQNGRDKLKNVGNRMELLHDRDNDRAQQKLVANEFKSMSTKSNSLDSLSADLNQLEAFVTNQVPPNKRILCLIVRDNSLTNANNSMKDLQLRLSKSKSQQTNPICYLFVQAIVDIEPINGPNSVSINCPSDQSSHERIKFKSCEESNNNGNPSSLNANNDHNETMQRSDDENDADDSISISSSLSADLLFVENARAANNANNAAKNANNSSNSKRDDDINKQTVTPNADLPANALQQQTNTIKGTNFSLINSFSDNDELSQRHESPLVYPNHEIESPTTSKFKQQPATSSIVALPQPNLSVQTDKLQLNNNNNNNNNKASNNNNYTTRTLFDNDLNPYTSAVSFVLSGKRRKNAKT